MTSGDIASLRGLPSGHYPISVKPGNAFLIEAPGGTVPGLVSGGYCLPVLRYSKDFS